MKNGSKQVHFLSKDASCRCATSQNIKMFNIQLFPSPNEQCKYTSIEFNKTLNHVWDITWSLNDLGVLGFFKWIVLPKILGNKELHSLEA